MLIEVGVSCNRVRLMADDSGPGIASKERR